MDKIKVQMVDLMGQYSKIKNQIDRNIISTIESGKFVNGPIVKEFSKNLSNYLVDNNSYDFWYHLKDEDINIRLSKIKGIGPWSIKMFLIFSLNRKDIFSSEDLGLIKAIGKNYYNGKIPDKKQAEELALKWSPWRTVACWFLWRSIDPNVVVY